MSMTTLTRPSGTTTLSTADVESGRGFDYWADAVTSTFVPLECRTQQSAAFHGDMVNRCLGDFQFTLVSAEAHRVARTRRMIALNDPGLMKVCLQVRGSGRINQDGREAEILPGDLTMYDTSRPYVLSFDHNPRGFETLVFMFPQAMMGLPIDAMFQLTATRVSGTEGIGLAGRAVLPRHRGGDRPRPADLQRAARSQRGLAAGDGLSRAPRPALRRRRERRGRAGSS